MLGSGGDVSDPSVAVVSKAPAIMAPRIPRPSVVENKGVLHYTFCNSNRHIEDTCFKKHWFPEWYLERRKKLKVERAARRLSHTKTADGGVGVAAVAVSQFRATTPVLGNAGPILSLVSQLSLFDSLEDAGNLKRVLITSDVRDPGWIIDSSATNHTTYAKSLFQYVTTPHKNIVVTTNGETTHMTGARSIALTPSLSLHHTLLVPALSNHLLSGEVSTLEEPTWFEVALREGEGRVHNTYIEEDRLGNSATPSQAEPPIKCNGSNLS
ncbi:hypothetical protein F0562_003490 [Nyssa sinensis]|uniref:Retrovirus-related Pol polyprotein from transposon TNT 1-94-like beta-barrel domain-containing protein n=1 Tax=Nyssa sinensis TaxID=561372 RepID=A0A5J5C0W4_9ASTE|nr:hypothetical protein F0562_003490 [Nyssa sinensis]